MDKTEYYKISKTEGLPKRCPILDKCERRIHTIALISYHDLPFAQAFSLMEKDGEISKNYHSEIISVKGEMPRYTDVDHYYDMCPEVNLFDTYHQNHFGETALSSLKTYFDTESRKTKYKTHFKHFSECAEFSPWLIENIQQRKRTPAKRKASISKTMRFEIFQRDNFTCTYCGKTKSDGIKLELDHVVPISKGGKDTFENLVTACSPCNLGKTDKSI